MKNNISIQIKAAFLLLVFGLNTVIGFACAVGVDMGFNTAHHHSKDAGATSVHVHANGKKHAHHNKAAHRHRHDDNKNDREKGGCCKDVVIRFSQTDKSVRQAGSLLHPIIFGTVINSFLIPGIFYQSHIAEKEKYFVREHPPPPPVPDIRIVIQSFQI